MEGGLNGVVMLESDYVLENGTEINLMTLNGEPLDLHIHGIEPKLILQEDARVHVVEHTFRAQIQGHLQVPARCIGFVWSMDREHVDTRRPTANCSICWKPIPDDESTSWNGRSTCFICEEECVEADSHFASQAGITHEGNCQECEPCDLCYRCKLHLMDGTPICIMCVTTEMLANVVGLESPTERLRFQILNPGIK